SQLKRRAFRTSQKRAMGGSAYPRRKSSAMLWRVGLDKEGLLAIVGRFDVLLGHEQTELRGLSQRGEGLVLHQLAVVVEPVHKGHTQAVNCVFEHASLGVEASQSIIQRYFLIGGRHFRDPIQGIADEDFGVEREGFAIGLDAAFVVVVGEVGGSEIAVEGGGIGFQVEGLVVILFRLVVILLAVVHGSQIIERLGIFGVQLQSFFILELGDVERVHMLVGHSELVPYHGGVTRGALISLNRGKVAAVNHHEVAQLFRRYGEKINPRRSGYGDGLRRRVALLSHSKRAEERNGRSAIKQRGGRDGASEQILSVGAG